MRNVTARCSARIDHLVEELALSLGEGHQLFLQATGQGKAPMFAESETEFFLKVVDAQVTFVREGQGRASKMILHQNGTDLPAPRTE